jgi:PAS domain S-box-containing protein
MHMEIRPDLPWRILFFTLVLPIGLVFLNQLNGSDVHTALQNAVAAFGSARPGAGIWLCLLILNAAVFLYLLPVFRFQKASGCPDGAGGDACVAAIKCLNHLDGFLIAASIASFLLGSGIASQDRVEAHLFNLPMAYSFMEALATGFLVGVSLSVNLGNVLFSARRKAAMLSPGLAMRRSSLYKKMFLIITALIFFTVFQVFSSSGSFLSLGAQNAGLQGVVPGPGPAGLGPQSPELRALLNLLFLRVAILFVFVAQLFLQIRWMITRPLETIKGRLAALNEGRRREDSGAWARARAEAQKKEIEIIQNDEFSSVYGEINKLIRKQDAELAVSQGRLDSITRDAADPIIVYDEECRILEFNPAAEAYFGLPAAAAKGRRIQELMEAAIGLGEDAESLFPRGADGKDGFLRHSARSAEGRELRFEAHASRTEGPEGRSYTVILRDILHQLEIEESLKKAKQAAENANRMKSEFLANMSHELRTPLNAVLGFTQLLAADKTLGPRQLEKVDIVSRSGEHLLALINDILDISKIEAGKVESHLTAFDLPRFVDDIREMFALRCQKKGLSLYVEPTSELPRWVEGDLGKLRQVVINLVGNAVKFTSEGGVGITVGRDGEGIRFAVVDSGKGIPADELELIVQPFTQSSITDHEGGTGLGLAISSRFIEMMGGKLEIASEVGKGSSFSFVVELPETEARPEEDRIQEAPIAVKKGSEVSVLIVDDKATNRLVLKEMLEAVGFSAIEAENGREAVEKALELRPAIVFMDIRMPEMDGYEAVAALKSRPEGRDMKIFALTASAFKHDEERIKASGFDGFLAKPFKRSALFQLIRDKTDVEMEYESSRPDEPPEAAAVDYEAARAALGAEAVEELASLASINDFSGAKAFAERIRGKAPELASAIRRAASGFDERGMEAIIGALRGAVGGEAGAKREEGRA